MNLKIITLVLLLTSPKLFAAEKQLTIQGVIHNFAGKPIKGVSVSVFHTKSPIDLKPVQSDDEGRYKIDTPVLDHYHVVYTHSDYHIDIIERLSNSKDQVINKVLCKPDEVNERNVVSVMSSYEELFALTKMQPVKGPEPFQEFRHFEIFASHFVKISELNGRAKKIASGIKDKNYAQFINAKSDLIETILKRD